MKYNTVQNYVLFTVICNIHELMYDALNACKLFRSVNFWVTLYVVSSRLCACVCVVAGWKFSRKIKKYKTLPVRDSTAVYNELIDNHVTTAPQPC